MIILRRAWLLCIPLLLAGCQTEPLPKGDIPTDFLFSYRYEQLEPPSAESVAALPRSWRITLDVAGYVDYEVHFGEPRPSVKSDGFSVPNDQLDRLYEAIRRANLHQMKNSYVGDESSAGREAFYVIGRNDPKEVTVEATTVPALTKLRELLFSELGILSILEPRVAAKRLVVLDWRTGVFYPADCPPAKAIPADARREFANPWDALNAGGTPSTEYDPFEGFE